MWENVEKNMENQRYDANIVIKSIILGTRQ